MPVSLYGQVADMDAINAIAARHGLAVIEDAAQSFGAATRAGTAASSPSAPPASSRASRWAATATAARSSPTTTRLAQAAREIRVHGQSARYTHTRLGVGGRMDTLQCAIVLAKLERFDWELQRRHELGARYAQLLDGLPRLQCWPCAPTAIASGRQYTVLVRQREQVQEALQAPGIPTAVHYPRPLHHQPAYAVAAPAPLPASERAAERVMSLPMSADLSAGRPGSRGGGAARPWLRRRLRALTPHERRTAARHAHAAGRRRAGAGPAAAAGPAADAAVQPADFGQYTCLPRSRPIRGRGLRALRIRAAAGARRCTRRGRWWRCAAGSCWP